MNNTPDTPQSQSQPCKPDIPESYGEDDSYCGSVNDDEATETKNDNAEDCRNRNSTTMNNTPDTPQPFKPDIRESSLERYVDDDSYCGSVNNHETSQTKNDDYRNGESGFKNHKQPDRREYLKKQCQQQQNHMDSNEDQESTASTDTEECSKRSSIGDLHDWEYMFSRLVAFQKANGHCLVPTCYPKDMDLALWVKQQRRQLKDFRPGATKVQKGDSLLQAKASRLERLGFEWKTIDPRLVIWETRFKELLAFVAKNGHAQVPIGWERNAALANWVSTQRQEYKNLKKGRYSKLNEERVELLDSIDFVWEAQRGGTKRKRKEGSSKVPVPQSMKNSSAATNSSINHYKAVAKHMLEVLGPAAKGQSAQSMRAALKDSQIGAPDSERKDLRLTSPWPEGASKSSRLRHPKSSKAAFEGTSPAQIARKENDDNRSKTPRDKDSGSSALAELLASNILSSSANSTSNFTPFMNGSTLRGSNFDVFSAAANLANANRLMEKQLSEAAAMQYAKRLGLPYSNANAIRTSQLLNPHLAGVPPFVNSDSIFPSLSGVSSKPIPTSDLLTLCANKYGLLLQQQQQQRRKNQLEQQADTEYSLSRKNDEPVAAESWDRKMKRQKLNR